MAPSGNRRQKARLKEIAKELGLSLSTVSRALSEGEPKSGRPRRTEEIRAVAKSFNYQVNAAARSLRTRRTRIIGVVVPDIANPVFPPIIRGIEKVISPQGYLSILVNSAARGPRHGEAMAMLQAQSVDGLIVGSVQRNDEVLRRLASDGMALVTINRRCDANVSSITHAEAEGIRLVLEHLHVLGHRRVVNIAGPQATSTGLGRYEAFELQRRSLGFDTAPELVVFADRYDEDEGDRCARLALDTLGNFTAIVTANDRLAAGVLSVLRQRGLRCPQDMSVTGFNDMPMVDRLDPPLTTIRVEQYDVGRRAAELLLKRIAAGPAFEPEHQILPVELVVRASTGRPPPLRPARGGGRR